MRYGAITGSTARLEPTSKQWIILMTLALFTTGSHYARHSLSGLGPALMETLNVKRTGFALLFAGENVPGIVLPILGGLILLYVPLAKTAIVLAITLISAATICAYGVDIRQYWVLATGRTLFGAAEGLMATLQGALIAKTFQNQQISVAFGVMLLVSRTSSFAGLTAPSWILTEFGLSTAMWVSVVILMIPLFASIVHFGLVDDDSVVVQHPTISEFATLTATSLHALRRLNVPFWIAAYTFMTVASSTFTFVHFAPDAFNNTVPGLSSTKASLLSGVLFLIAGLTSPIVGIVADRVGKRPNFLIFASTCSSLGLLICAVTLIYPRFGEIMVIIGTACLMISLCVAPVLLLACVAIVVPTNTLPLALGAYKSLENIGLAIVHVIVGRLRDVRGDYAAPMIFLAALAISAVPVLFILSNMAPRTNDPANLNKLPVVNLEA